MEYLPNDYVVAKKNNKPEFTYNNFEASEKSISKI